MSDETRINDEILLRPVTSDDREFLLGVYRSTREMELALVPWDDAMKRSFVEQQFGAQTSYYLSEHPNARHDVVELATGEPVGRIYVDRSEEMISILDLTVLPEHQGRGIGSAIISWMIDEVQPSGRSIAIYIETYNHSQKFFTSRGFSVTEMVGVYNKLVWSPSQKH